MTDPIQIAQERFAQGFNCSQAVLSAYAERFGLHDEMALKLASPFGGGVARQGQVCGAVTGALMVLGLQKGNATLEKKEETYKQADEFLQKFQKQHGTLLCRELIGYDMTQPEELQSAREQNMFKTICPGLVRDAAKLVDEFLDD